MDLLVGKVRMVRFSVGESLNTQQLFKPRDRVTTETEHREALGAGRGHIATGGQRLEQEAAQHQNQPGTLPASVSRSLI